MPPTESRVGIAGIAGIAGMAGPARLRFESARFESVAAEYEQWNLQPPDLIEELATRIAGEGNAPHLPVVLSGEPGIGRGYLVRSALFQAERRGARAALAVLDLDGWEPERADLAAYLEHRLRREAPGRPDRGAVLQEILGQGSLVVELPSAWLASLLSIGISLKLPAGKLSELLMPGGEAGEPREGARPRRARGHAAGLAGARRHPLLPGRHLPDGEEARRVAGAVAGGAAGPRGAGRPIRRPQGRAGHLPRQHRRRLDGPPI